jgi:hypothetical protein
LDLVCPKSFVFNHQLVYPRKELRRDKKKKPCFTRFPKHTEKEENIFGFSKTTLSKSHTFLLL